MKIYIIIIASNERKKRKKYTIQYVKDQNQLFTVTYDGLSYFKFSTEKGNLKDI